METLYNIDKAIFYLFNHNLANPFFDKLFVILTTQDYWYITYAVLIYFLLTKFKAEGRIFLIVLILCIFVADQLSSHVIKELVGRIRPCHTLPDVRLLVPCGGGKSFPSSHAVNNFAFAVLMSYFFDKYKLHFLIIASLIAISRIYVGVHYPFDVISGAVVGSLVGILFVYLYRYILNYYLKRFKNET